MNKHAGNTLLFSRFEALLFGRTCLRCLGLKVEGLELACSMYSVAALLPRLQDCLPPPRRWRVHRLTTASKARPCTFLSCAHLSRSLRLGLGGKLFPLPTWLGFILRLAFHDCRKRTCLQNIYFQPWFLLHIRGDKAAV